jgi:predicted phosphodiesterase
MIKFQIFSDIHEEAYNDIGHLLRVGRINPIAKHAIVAGDIHSRFFEEELNYIAEKFETVIAIYGNHEWYRRDISWKHNPAKLAPNVKVLNPGTCVVDGVRIVGATLWTDFDNKDWFVVQSANNGINDFRGFITVGDKNFKAHNAYDIHVTEKQFIKDTLEAWENDPECDKVIVVTHFVPSFNLIHPRWRQHGGYLNSYFSANCDDLFEVSKKVKAWVFGHTHDGSETMIGDIQFVSNPYGYPREMTATKYQDKVIEV